MIAIFIHNSYLLPHLLEEVAITEFLLKFVEFQYEILKSSTNPVSKTNSWNIGMHTFMVFDMLEL